MTGSPGVAGHHTRMLEARSQHRPAFRRRGLFHVAPPAWPQAPPISRRHSTARSETIVHVASCRELASRSWCSSPSIMRQYELAKFEARRNDVRTHLLTGGCDYGRTVAGRM